MQDRSKMSIPPRKATMRQLVSRPLHSRAMSAAPVMTGRQSPAESLVSHVGASSKQRSPNHLNTLKRKDRDFDQELGEETNINVVVRCRGRNSREVKENSGVVVSTDGMKGNIVDLSMGPNAVSNKTYSFDKVFSPAADQSMVFDEVVAPILDQVIAGFNCTIFAYGQTGTGKTYTMSGDITDLLPLPDEAGIIPRVLHALFDRLESQKTEKSVKCSFIELYNEDLKDLLSADETTKLKIFDDASRKSQSATLVQGMEETHIQSAARGIQLLRDGSHKRQVAATKCNDLSSRSHTVFSIYLRMKVLSENGEEYVNAGKLNLVDLAGSENIQRSGAENKRATEAGLINKSLLTLGRVINALVDKSSHIPYRESKLTRLLQDSLGGRTKTCIIATLSPAKSNLEETISTLDYAFRAKNIRNKPQMNQLISKKTLFKEFTMEIEKLKSELIATRLRNGVYLTADTYEEMTVESESRRILSEEQRDKIETLEVNLRNKNQELFSLTTNFQTLKKDNEAVRNELDNTKSVLDKTDIILQHTKDSLAEEKVLREAHETTEEHLASIGYELIDTLGKTTSDIGGLNSKLRRRSDLQSLNRNNWASSQRLVSDVTSLSEQKLKDLEASHRGLMENLSSRMSAFVQEEVEHLLKSRQFVAAQTELFEASEKEMNANGERASNEIAQVLDQIKTLRDEMKLQLKAGLDGLTEAGQRISEGIISELDLHHTQLHSSYTSLGKDCKTTFDKLLKDLESQKSEAEELRQQLQQAEAQLLEADQSAAARLDTILAEEREQAVKERNDLLSQITALISSQGQSQEKRLELKIKSVQKDILTSSQSFKIEQAAYETSVDKWNAAGNVLVEDLLKSRETVKTKFKQDWSIANERNSCIQSTTQAVHQETAEIVDAQMKHIDTQLQTLDEIISHVKTQNSSNHDLHLQSLSKLTSAVRLSYGNISEHFADASGRAQALQTDVAERTLSLEETVKPLCSETTELLADLRTDILSTALTEYIPTGATPLKSQYNFVSTLPRTQEHGVLLLKMRKPTTLSQLEDVDEISDLANISPSKAPVFQDIPDVQSSPSSLQPPLRPASADGGLGEIKVIGGSLAAKIDPVKQNNTVQIPLNDTTGSKIDRTLQPPLKRQHTGNSINMTSNINGEIKEFSASLGSKNPRKAVAEGRENIPPGSLSSSASSRSLRTRSAKS